MISVAMAAYNGRLYIKEQIDSILCQLTAEDELCVCVDPCEDGTMELVQELAGADSRIKVATGPGKGTIANFERAISMCKGDIIFLADQDDVWSKDKVSHVTKCMADTASVLVLHDVVVMDGKLEQVIKESFFELKGSRPGILRNIIKNSFMGSAMAFKRELVPYILPFPKGIPMHDQWIGLVAEKKGKVTFIDDKLMSYRRHGDNVSGLSHAGVFDMIRWRVAIILAILKVK